MRRTCYKTRIRLSVGLIYIVRSSKSVTQLADVNTKKLFISDPPQDKVFCPVGPKVKQKHVNA